MAVSAELARAMQAERTVDITTTGRKSGKQTRIETWIYPLGNEYYLTGSPGKRDWYANLLANPEFVVHVKRGATGDLKARAVPIDQGERRALFARIFETVSNFANRSLDEWEADSPLLRVEFE